MLIKKVSWLEPNGNAHCSGYGTINTCQSSFSMSKIVESKFWNSLTDENIVNELRCASTKLPVDINSRRTKEFCAH